MAAMHTTMIRASMTAYSTAVGPSSFFRNDTRLLAMLRMTQSPVCDEETEIPNLMPPGFPARRHLAPAVRGATPAGLRDYGGTLTPVSVMLLYIPLVSVPMVATAAKIATRIRA